MIVLLRAAATIYAPVQTQAPYLGGIGPTSPQVVRLLTKLVPGLLYFKNWVVPPIDLTGSHCEHLSQVAAKYDL